MICLSSGFSLVNRSDGRQIESPNLTRCFLTEARTKQLSHVCTRKNFISQALWSTIWIFRLPVSHSQVLIILTFGVEHSGDVKVLLSNVESQVEVVQRVVLGQLGVVQQVRPVPVDEGAERQTITPAQVEVLHVDVLVGGGLALAPEQQTLLGSHLLNGDVLDGEPEGKKRSGKVQAVENVPENDGPDHSQGHLDIAINNLLGTNGHQLHTLAGDEVQSLVHIRDLVEPKSQSMR